MTFQANVPMSRAKAVLAIELYKGFRNNAPHYSHNFSEPRRKSRKIKFWMMPRADRDNLARAYIACKIPFYYSWDDNIAINVPLNVTLSSVKGMK